jgi:hypothetical protein
MVAKVLIAAGIAALAAARPQVVVQKSLTGLDARAGLFDGYVVVGQNFTVTYDVSNVGGE